MKTLLRVSTSARVAMLAALTALVLAPPARAQQSAEAYEYDIHYATSPATAAGGSAPEPENVAVQHALQGPEVALLWNTDQEYTTENARFARHEEVLGLLMPKWSTDRSAAEATGWTFFGRAINYETFEANIRRGDDDRTIAGHPATHYVFEAHLTKQVEGSTQKQRFDTTTDVWVLEGRPFSWAPFAVFGTQGVNADARLRVALAERLAERGMVARAETRLAFEMLAEDGSADRGSEQRFHMWIEDVTAAAPPATNAPTVSRATAQALNENVKRDPLAFCKAVLDGSPPAFVRDALPEEQQAVYVEHARSQCEKMSER